ncbi:MAG: hypothetical protein NT126_09395 [Bacteroidetes bacterium]|nr:hypothetical protein [Bacteroidota bacterium]
MKNKNLFLISGMIALAVITRFIPHPDNFTAIGAIALFSGSVIRDKRFAFLVPVIALFISDLVIGLHPSVIPVYSCFAFTVLLGISISKKQNVLNIAVASAISSIVFFLVTNLPFWYADLSLYPLTLQGTIQSYTMALPFFFNQLAGDLFYNGLLFLGYVFVSKKIFSIA